MGKKTFIKKLRKLRDEWPAGLNIEFENEGKIRFYREEKSEGDNQAKEDIRIARRLVNLITEIRTKVSYSAAIILLKEYFPIIGNKIPFMRTSGFNLDESHNPITNTITFNVCSDYGSFGVEDMPLNIIIESMGVEVVNCWEIGSNLGNVYMNVVYELASKYKDFLTTKNKEFLKRLEKMREDVLAG